MLATVLHGPRDVRFEDVPEPKILKPTDAVIQLSATCICGSDLWPYRGLQDMNGLMNMGHEYCGIVLEVGSDVRSVRQRRGTCDALPMSMSIITSTSITTRTSTST